MYNTNVQKKLVIAVAVMLLATLGIALLINNPLLLSCFLILIACTKHKLIPIKKELMWFALVSIGSAIGEIFLVNVTHAWSYANPHLFNVPLYAPLYWGLLGTTLALVYNLIIRE